MELYYGVILWSFIMELYYGVILWSYISVKIQFSNSECKDAIQNAECQSVNPEMSIHEVRIQSRNAESTSGIQIVS